MYSILYWVYFINKTKYDIKLKIRHFRFTKRVESKKTKQIFCFFLFYFIFISLSSAHAPNAILGRKRGSEYDSILKLAPSA